MTYLIKTISDA